jgi:lipoteichoic acid synthase
VLDRLADRLSGSAGLSHEDWLRTLALMGPLVVYLIGLKLARIHARHEPSSAWTVLGLVRSDVLAGTAVAAVGLAALVLARPGRWRRATFAVVSVAVTVVALLQTVAHLFYLKTGSPFDLAVAAAAWTTRGEIGDLIGSQLSDGCTAWLVAVGTWCLLGPATVVLLARWRRGPDRSRRPQPSAPRRQRAAVLAASLAIGLTLLAALPSASGTSFARDPLLNAALSPLEAMRYAHAAGGAANTDPPLHTSLQRNAAGKPPNVVLVFLESVRGISTTVDDSEQTTTPFLAKLAKTSLVADNAYTVVPHTSKALTAGNCGVTPPLDMSVTEAKPNGISGRCLPALLTEQGYATAFFQSATEHYDSRRELVQNFGYGDFYPVDMMDKEGYVGANYFGWEDDIMLGPSRAWLTKHRDQPFMTGYLTVTSHHDYKVPTTIDTEHLSDDPELNAYLNTVRYGDRFVQRLIQQYKDLGLYDNTVFVIMADHGEGFGEHGLRQHDNTIYTEGVRIPLLVHDPRKPQGRRVEAPVQLTSVLPTVVERLGFDVTGGSYPADSLDDVSGQQPARIACYVDNVCLASITGTQKYIFHFGRQPDEYFDLASDPQERHNLISRQDPDHIAALRADLLRWRADVRAQTTRHGS